MLTEEPDNFHCGTCHYDDDQFDRDCICCGYQNGGIIEDNSTFMHARCRYWSQMQRGPCIVCVDGIEDQFVITCTVCKKNNYHIPCALEKKLIPMNQSINLFTKPPKTFRCVECRNMVLSKQLGMKPVSNGVELVSERKNVIIVSSNTTSVSESIHTLESDSLSEIEEKTVGDLINASKKQRFIEVLIPFKRKSTFATSNSKRMNFRDCSEEEVYVLTPEELENRLHKAQLYLDNYTKSTADLINEDKKIDSKILATKFQLQEVETTNNVSIFEDNPNECPLLELLNMSFVDRVKNGESEIFPSMVEIVNTYEILNKDANKLIELLDDIQAGTVQSDVQVNRSTHVKLEREIEELKSKKDRLTARISELSGQTVASSGDFQDMANLCRQFLSNISTNMEIDKYTSLSKQLSEIISDFEELDIETLKYFSAHAFNAAEIYNKEE